MAIKTKYRLKNTNGAYDIIHFQTSAEVVVTTENLQFISKQEKDKLNNKLGTYTYNQQTPQTTWEIQHNLGRFPSVTILDSLNKVVVGDVTYVNENTIRVEFLTEFAGRAYLN